MPENLRLHHPWLVAVWPGMGHVALNAGVYLLSKLGMTAVAELESGELFDIDHVEVKEGIIQPARRARNRFFVWNDPKKEHDLVVFLGEAQPPIGRFPFCRQVMGFAREVGVERVFTFAAMATRMHPEHRSRVFGAVTEREGLDELQRLDLELLEDGNIGGLNGVLLAAAAEVGLPGVCFLGEMPHIFARLPFPKASLAILEVFKTISGIKLDLGELAEQAQAVEEQLGELLAQVEEQYGQQFSGNDEDEDEESEPESVEIEGVEGEEPDRDRIAEMFQAAAKDRSKAFELKRELDRLGLFKEYEDRFLDLFQKQKRE
ncbi:MAG TPA: PAC2 family protein [Gemmata sp.]|nr:PAC2 family protein [Gemmata sp.]